MSGNPIVFVTGSKRFFYNDYYAPATSLNLARFYSNMSGNPIAYAPSLGMGTGWRYDFQIDLTIAYNFNLSKDLSLSLPSGAVIDFARNSDGSMSAKYAPYNTSVNNASYQLSFTDPFPSNWDSLETQQSHWRLVDPDRTIWILEGVNSNYSNPSAPSYRTARPVSRTTSDGRKTVFTYGSLGEMLSMADEFGHTSSFSWNYIDYSLVSSDTTKVPFSLKSVSLPDGSNIFYTYAPTYVSPTAIQFPDRLARFERKNASGVIIDAQDYAFDNSSYPFHITSIKDLRNIIVNSVTYDANGRAIQSTLANGLDATSVVYETLPNFLFQRTVTNALGKKAIYKYQGGDFGAWRFKGVEGLASTNCAAGVTAVTYDDNGYVITETDEENRKTVYTRDALGRPTSITRGAP